jgi:hypothetical protein
MKKKSAIVVLQFFFSVGMMLIPGAARAQANFVQITDPHIFDDTWPEDRRLEDRAALASCINQINERNRSGADYQFVVVTGDLGVEDLVQRVKANKGSDEVVQKSLANGAVELAGLLMLSSVKTWLFVPGNNDVVDEVPENVRYYHQFLQYLVKAIHPEPPAADNEPDNGIKIVDLCPRDDSKSEPSYGSRCTTFQLANLPGFAFVGFNDSFFKNKKPSDAIDRYAAAEKESIANVQSLLQPANIKYAYIFYHVPEIDDPYFVTLTPENDDIKVRTLRLKDLGGSFLYSAWFVKSDVRDEWNKVVRNPKVKGLFAGHFHDFQTQSYAGFNWVRSTDYLSETLTKLHVCPPLAVRMQGTKVNTARGFQEVHTEPNGDVTARTVWLNQSQWDYSPGDAESARELAVANTLEANGDDAGAVAALTQAAKSNWPPTRVQALESLQRIKGKDPYGFRRYLATPLTTGWVAGVSAFGGLLFTAVLSLLLLLGGSRIVKGYARKHGKRQLRVGAFVDATARGTGASLAEVIKQVHGIMQVRYKRRPPLLQPDIEFPVLIGSLSAEVPGVVEAILPGGVGKVLAWLWQNSRGQLYGIEGTIQADTSTQTTMFVAAVRGGENLGSWILTTRNVEVATRQLIVAHASLDAVIEEMNNGRT